AILLRYSALYRRASLTIKSRRRFAATSSISSRSLLNGLSSPAASRFGEVLIAERADYSTTGAKSVPARFSSLSSRLDVELQLRRQAPNSLRKMVATVCVHGGAHAIVEDVIERGVHLVGGLAARPVHRLSGIVLVVTDPRHIDHGKPRIWKVAEHE